jgi:putative (di)nucleoside polyphosphate hydrolase
MNTPYFRAGTGSVIYRADGMVLIFKRAGENIWQFQQGGLDASEAIESALWRELKEETALSQSDFVQQHPYPTWTLYEYPDGLALPESRSLCVGQAHKWWFLKIAPNTTINLAKASDKEFDDHKWISFSEFMDMTTHSFKQTVYEELYKYFNTHILPSSE